MSFGRISLVDFVREGKNPKIEVPILAARDCRVQNFDLIQSTDFLQVPTIVNTILTF